MDVKDQRISYSWRWAAQAGIVAPRHSDWLKGTFNLSEGVLQKHKHASVFSGRTDSETETTEKRLFQTHQQRRPALLICGCVNAGSHASVVDLFVVCLWQLSYCSLPCASRKNLFMMGESQGGWKFCTLSHNTSIFMEMYGFNVYEHMCLIL